MMTQYTEADLKIYSSSEEVIHKIYDKDPLDFSSLVIQYTQGLLHSENNFNLKIIGRWAVFSSELD